MNPESDRHRSWHWLLTAILFSISSCATAVGDPPPSPALYLKSQVIRQDTDWSGQIIIEGVVVVGRRATLTIAPGTSVRFRKIDNNGDGIGDSELQILGGIMAEGTSDRPIIFASAEEKPARRDWSYLLIYSSSRLNRLSFCEFRHAFSGLQVHFSTASVNNCLFSDNKEGLRFGRADLSIVNNLFTNNDLGVRFTRMEGPVLLQANEITGNRIGIFLVPSGQNIRDFFEPDRTPRALGVSQAPLPPPGRNGQAWNTDRLKISGNNIYANSSYNLSLGEKQFLNLEISGNYWGSTSPAEIAGTIFDQHRDNSLGQVIFTPFAAEKIKEAGIGRR